QSPGLVQLDVDGLITIEERGQVRGGVAGLICADRYPARELQQAIVRIGRKGLLEEAHGRALERRLHLTQDVDRPALVGVYYEFGRRGGLPHRFDPRNWVVSIDFDLDQLVAGDEGGSLRHLLRRVDADRQCSDERRTRRPGQLFPYRHPAESRIQVPQRRVQCVARRSRGKAALQLVPAHAGRKGATQGLDLRHHGSHGFAVAAIGNGFAASHAAFLAELDGHHIRRNLDATRDAERRSQRQSAVPDVQRAQHESKLSTMDSTPMVTGSSQGSPNRSPISRQAACASWADTFEVLSATPTALTSGLVKLAAVRLASRHRARSGSGRSESPRMCRRVSSWHNTRASGCAPWSSPSDTPAYDGWNSDPCPSMRSHPSSSRAGEIHSTAPEMKSAMTASTGMPPPAMKMPVCPVARKSAVSPRFRMLRSSASVVYILPTEQSVPTVNRRRPERLRPVPTGIR